MVFSGLQPRKIFQVALGFACAAFVVIGLVFVMVGTFDRVSGEQEATPGRGMEKKAGISVGSTSRDQDDFEIFIDDPSVFFASTPERVSYSWAFIPDHVESQGPVAVKSYFFDKYFAFRTDARNFLIVDDSIVPKGKMKIALVQWSCTTEDCDTYEEMSDPVLLPFGDLHRGDFKKGYRKEKTL